MPEIFGRDSRIVIGTLELVGFAARFSIHKDDTRDPNTCELEIDNLNPDQRAQIAELNPKKGDSKGIPCKIEAGYDSLGGPQLLWLGDLRTSLSVRKGPTWSTKVGSGDGEAAVSRSRIQKSFGPRTPVSTVVRALVDSLGIGTGNLPKVLGQLRAGNVGSLALDGAVLSGPTAYHLDNWTRSAGMSWSIQDGAIQFLIDDKPLGDRVVKLSPETGLVGTPTVNAEGELSATSFIIPGVHVGAVIVVESSSVEGAFQITKTDYTGDTYGPQWHIGITAKRY